MTSFKVPDIVCFEVGSGDSEPWVGTRMELASDWTALQLQQERGLVYVNVSGDRVYIRGGTRVGVVLLPSGRRLVARSKISGVVLLDWLAYLGEFPHLTSWLAAAGVTVGDDMPECIAKLFLFALEHVTRRHMRREYLSARVSKPEIRGKILPSLLAQRFHQLPRIPQLQRHRTYNTPANVVLAFALDRLPFLLAGQAAALRRVARLREQWSDIDRGSLDAYAAMMEARHQCPPGYRDALQLARLILIGAALDAGSKMGSHAFTVCLASVWERALGRMLDELASASGWRRMNKERHHRCWSDSLAGNDSKRWLLADFILERQSLRWVLDAKYKSEFGHESRNDRFQICTYALAFDADRASLIYPDGGDGGSVRELLTGTFGGRAVRIDSIGLPMHAGPEICRTALMMITQGAFLTDGVRGI